MQVRAHQLQDKTSFNFILQGFSGLFTLEAKYVQLHTSSFTALRRSMVCSRLKIYTFQCRRDSVLKPQTPKSTAELRGSHSRTPTAL